MPSSEPLEMMIETFWIAVSMADRPVRSSSVSGSRSDAAAGLGNSGDLGGGLGRAFREELVQRLYGDAGGLAEPADGGPGPLGLVLGAHEPDSLPVPRRQLVDAL